MHSVRGIYGMPQTAINSHNAHIHQYY